MAEQSISFNPVLFAVTEPCQRRPKIILSAGREVFRTKMGKISAKMEIFFAILRGENLYHFEEKYVFINLSPIESTKKSRMHPHLLTDFRD
jgi:hypothetical protein